MRIFVIVLLSLCIIAMSFSQVPQLINYQGKLDTAGIPLNGTSSLTFKIYDAETAGNTLWTETQTVNLTNGIFNVLLGSVTAFSDTLFTTAGERYIGVTVSTLTEMTQRLKITSVAYSLRASIADSLADNTVSTQKIKDQAVTLAKLAPGLSIPPSGVAGGDLTGSYPNPTIANGVVNNIKLADNIVSTSKIQDQAVTQIKIASGVSIPPSGTAGGDLTGSYPNPTITTGAINSAKILNGSITGSDIADNTILSTKLSNATGVSCKDKWGAYYLTSNGSFAIDSVDITIPSQGDIIVTGTGYLNLYHTNGTTTSVSVSVDETRAYVVPAPGLAKAEVPSIISTSTWRYPCSVQRRYSKANAGTYRIYLNAYYPTGTSTLTSVSYGSIYAVYYPKWYGTASSKAIDLNIDNNMNHDSGD